MLAKFAGYLSIFALTAFQASSPLLLYLVVSRNRNPNLRQTFQIIPVPRLRINLLLQSFRNDPSKFMLCAFSNSQSVLRLSCK